MTTPLPAQSARSAPAASKGLRMVARSQFDWAETAVGELSPDEVIIEVAGCGVCHTDIGFAYEGIPTRHALPLILGHEIAGRVVLGGEQAENWIGRSVIVPAVIPCGACDACRSGRLPSAANSSCRATTPTEDLRPTYGYRHVACARRPKSFPKDSLWRCCRS